MLNIISYNTEEYDFPCLLVLGCFDAIHIGHDKLLKEAKLQAKINGLDLGVMMFTEGKGDKQIYSFEERVSLLEQYNVKFVLKIDFTEEFKKTKPLDFLAAIENKLNVKAYMSGKDFRFGEKASGKSSTLKKYAEDEENGVWYTAVKDVLYGENKVSTTRIKELVENGEVNEVSLMLGRHFSVTGEVVQGEGRGKSLGYPTLNINYPEYKVELKHGVYGVKCTVDDTEYLGVANYGNKPTFDNEKIQLEVYLQGFSGDLYGQNVTVEFVKYLREIQKFDTDEELKAQLLKDVENACAQDNADEGTAGNND